jgi:regulatory protein YycH of two-component signal transduction system YycFG
MKLKQNTDNIDRKITNIKDELVQNSSKKEKYNDLSKQQQTNTKERDSIFAAYEATEEEARMYIQRVTLGPALFIRFHINLYECL